MYNKRKVLFFLPSNTGGAERMTVTIAKMLPLDKFEVKFVIVHKNLGTITTFIPTSYEILHIPIRNIYCATTLRMINLILREKPDVVFSSMLYLNARLIVAAKTCGVKVIVRNNIDLHNAKPINKRLAKATYKWANIVIAQQDEMRNEILDVITLPATKVVTMQNPLDIDTISNKCKEESPFTASNEKQIKYVWAGRFDTSKGQDLLVQAFRRVLAVEPNSHLYFIGHYDWSREYDKNIKNFVEQNNLTDNVHFIGFDSNPYKWIKNCDCYVMPSRKEGLPNSLIEAMYLGKPVVATRCIPIIERIVDDGVNGYVVDSENIKDIAEAMIKALELKDFSFSYTPATKEDFIKLFNI